MPMDSEAGIQKGGDYDIDSMHPLIQDKLYKPRTVFTPGSRLLMNIVPMFVSTFVPWGAFILCCGTTSFWLMYSHPAVVWIIVGCAFAASAVMITVAVWNRIFNPEPTWFTYMAVMVLAMCIAGTITGLKNYTSYSKQYFEIQMTKTYKGIDASVTPGSSVMDAGILEFLPGSRFDETKSWHFMNGKLYCVAPILTNGTVPPLSQTYDFWAVGTDCCSMGASDFRCGAWGSARAKAAIRMANEAELPNYRLAVQQTASLYNLKAPSPIFVQWSNNAQAEISSWNQQIFKWYMLQLVFTLVINLFCMTLAASNFACIGRRASAYQKSILGNSSADYGNAQPLDYRVRTMA